MLNWFDPKADHQWVERIKQENQAWEAHNFINRYRPDAPYINNLTNTTIESDDKKH